MAKLIKGKIIIPSRSTKGKFYEFDPKTLTPTTPCLSFYFRKTCWHYKQAMEFVQSDDAVSIMSQMRSQRYPLLPKDPFKLNSDTHGY